MGNHLCIIPSKLGSRSSYIDPNVPTDKHFGRRRALLECSTRLSIPNLFLSCTQANSK
ncbi:hypothetical protein MANES_15G096125v8 [Manihot esculenta]|uniref:Uncharacterized protein n=1 Tax=Manihot esculenta TaxID=3983 RepID=A0ACB7GBH3_MANES|nr:hypothetical protein MANES_15G096125v8 [Manihot esculenta]